MRNSRHTTDDAPDFIIRDVLELAEYTDHGAAVMIVDAEGRRLRLHLGINMGELLCERIASALERRYGPGAS